jgi:uncharacterized repeat protein (TIGR03806 family)
MRNLFIGLCVVVFAACSQQQAVTPVYHADVNPAVLSAWGQVVAEGETLVLAETVLPYDLATPLFSDYAHKLRTVWLPAGTSATYEEEDTFNFPIGTVITKTFYYPVAGDTASPEVLKVNDQAPLQSGKLDLIKNRLIETRVLVHRETGWAALPYVWNEEQTDAELKRIGDIKNLVLVDGAEKTPFPYVVPDANQCAGCHATNNTTRAIMPIGPKARHLNKDYAYTDGVKNQLSHWQEAQLLTGAPAPTASARNALWQGPGETLDAKARAYLDINCSHCHNKVGPADTSGLHLEPATPEGPALGFCKLPVAAGSGTGDRKFDIHPGKPDDSIFVYRMASTDPGAMMPELGRALAHEEGVELIREWIASLDGGCS